MTRIVPVTSPSQKSLTSAEAYFASRYPGYRLKDCLINDTTGRLEAFVLTPQERGVLCPKCGTYCSRWKEVNRTIRISDFDFAAGGPCTVIVPSRRIRCRCGCTKTESAPEWVLPGHRITKRLAAFVQQLLKLRITIRDVSRITGLNWELIKEIDKAALELNHGQEKDLSQVRRIAIDEISIHKGQHFATMVMDLENVELLFGVEGKKQADLRPIFEKMRATGANKHIQSVSVDMNAGFPKLVKQYLPNAKLAYDRFHVMQMLNRDVLFEARRYSMQQARQKYAALPAKERKLKERVQERDVALGLVRQAEWLVITDTSLLSPDRQERLRRLREGNQLFADLYAFVAKLKTVWGAPTEHVARTILNECIELCEAMHEAHAFKPILRFGKMLRRRAEGIVNACLVGYGTNILEGANNTAKVIKRVAYGFRDFDYFILKLKAAFPGKRFKEEAKTAGIRLAWGGCWETLRFPQIS